MSTKAMIVVTGATGLQGGSVVKYLLEDGIFEVRATTRDVESTKAKELSTKGVQVVQADFNDLESMKRAFRGAYGVFGMTNFWDPTTREANETKQGKVLVDAAKAEAIKHFVWSTLEHTKDPIVPHWNTKADVNDYLIASGVPRTSLYTVTFQENFVRRFTIRQVDGSSYEANWPYLATDGRLWAYPAADTGVWVLEAFKKPEEWIGKDMRILTELFTPREYVKIVEEESGKTIKLQEVSFDDFDRIKDDPRYHELWLNISYFYKHDPMSARDMVTSKRIHSKCPTLRQWVKANLDSLFSQSGW